MSLPLESQVVSLPLAKRLKDLGVNTPALFRWWLSDEKDRKVEYGCLKNHNQYDNCISAFTVAELGEMLLHDCRTVRRGENPKEGWNCDYGFADKWVLHQADTEADARAKMLIYLLENNLITV